MATVEAASAADTEFFINDMSQPCPAGNCSFRRTYRDAGAATVTFCVDICFGSDFYRVDKAFLRAGVNRCYEILIGGEIIHPGQVVDHTDCAGGRAFDATSACGAPYRAVGKHLVAGVMVIAGKENFMDVGNERNKPSGAFIDACSAAGAFVTIDFRDLVFVDRNRAEGTDRDA